MGHLKDLFTLIIVSWISAQCQKELSSPLKLVVVSNQGVPINNASVLIDGVKVGLTSDQGELKYDLTAVKGKPLNLEVSKDSPTHYFAPHYEKILLKTSRNKPVEIKAVLYSVPKPKKGQSLADKKRQRELEDDIPEPMNADHPLVSGTQAKAGPLSKPENPREKTKIDSALEGRKSQELAGHDPEVPTPAPPMDEAPKSTPPADNLAAKAKATRISLTVHVTSEKRPIADAEVYLGNPERAYLKSACKTNPKGGCTIHMQNPSQRTLAFVVKKHGFVTRTITTLVKDHATLQVVLTRGQCLDIFTLKSNYQYLRGVFGIGVYVNGKQVGNTDKFGHLSYVYEGPSNDLLKVSFKTKRHLPEVFETDFISSPKMTLTKFLTDIEPPKPKFTVLPVRVAGGVDLKRIPNMKRINRHIHSAFGHISSLNMASEYPYESLVRSIQAQGKSLEELLASGWSNLEVKAKLDALVLPTILIKNGDLHMELSLYSNKGEVLLATSHPAGSLDQPAAYDKLMKEMAVRVNRSFPFEGAVLAANGNQLRINFNRKNAKFLEPDDLIEVFGRQINPLGSAQEHKKVAIAKVKSVADRDSLAEIVWRAPRSVLARGDMLVLRKGAGKKYLSQKKTYPIRIHEEPVAGKPQRGIAQVNVYYKGRWLGSSDADGLVSLRNGKDVGAGGALTLVKHGYETKKVNFPRNRLGRLEVSLKRLIAFVQVDTKPSGASVYLDGRLIGRTPIHQAFETSSGFVKLSIAAPPGYKDVSRVLELDEGVLDLTAGARLHLERDVLKSIEGQIKAARYDKALASLKQVDKQHSDYLYAQHLLGELYLTQVNDPARAAKAFKQVISSPKVKSFKDKKFIGTYINYAQALIAIAGKQEAQGDSDKAKQTYHEIVDLARLTQAYLKYSPEGQYALAAGKLKYFEAFSVMKLAKSSADPALKQRSLKLWQEFVYTFGADHSLKDGVHDLLGEAKVYLRQANATMYRNDVKL